MTTPDQERAAPAQQPVAIVSKRVLDCFDVNGTEIVDALLFPKGALRPDEEAHLYDHPSSEPELRAEIVRLQAEVERLTADRATVARIWKSLGIKTYEEAGGREISEIVADLTSRVEALLAEVGTARAAAFEEAAQVADMLRGDIGKAIRAHAAIRSRAALDEGATS